MTRSDRDGDAPPLGLFFFAGDAVQARRALDAGVDTLMVDWEWRGKAERQKAADTEINAEGPEDLRRMAALGPSRLCCRLNALGPWTADEVEAAIEGGASDLILPMVRTAGEVESFLERVAGRVRAGILIETPDACERAEEIAGLELDLVYVGLNDLALGRGHQDLFRPVVDGTIEKLRQIFAGTDFGFGGLTVVDGGSPVACRALAAEMARLRCSFSFLRRSFRREVRGREMAEEVSRLRRLWADLWRRDAGRILADRQALEASLEALYGAPSRLEK